MTHPLPHSFSRSPVEEVFCRVTLGPGSDPISLAIPPPYPGWTAIRERIKEMITGAGEVSRITGCTLRYTDLLPVPLGMALPGTREIEQLFSGNYTCETAQDEIVFTSTTIHGTVGSVRSIHPKPGKPGWTLAFTMQTDRSDGFLASDDVIEWFDGARAEIHGLFDLIVPEEIVELLR